MHDFIHKNKLAHNVMVHFCLVYFVYLNMKKFNIEKDAKNFIICTAGMYRVKGTRGKRICEIL